MFIRQQGYCEKKQRIGGGLVVDLQQNIEISICNNARKGVAI